MPDPITPLPSTFNQLPSQAVHERFATRPTLYSVVFKALRNAILARYPSLELDLLTVKLASAHPDGHYTYQLLMEVAIAHVLNPQWLDWHSRRELPYYLTQKIPNILKPATLPLIDMQAIAQIIDQLRTSLFLHFQHDLADYWSAIDSHGNSRWQWFGEFLKGRMTAIVAGQSSLTETQRDMLKVVATWPVLASRLPHSSPVTYVYFIETTLVRAGTEARLLTPDLLLVRDKQVLLYSVAGETLAFDCLDSFGHAWGARMQARFEFDSITWRRNEHDGNVFEQQAGLILNQQLEDFAALTFEGQDEKALERRLENLTDPALLFTNAATAPTPLLQKVNDQLPAWLSQATADDRFAYHRHLQDMAQVLRLNEGRSFKEGIENIHRFSRDALRKQMQADHGDFDPDEVELDFAVAAGYPGGAGIISHVKMSLTELALKNLAGKPKGTLTLASKGADALPAWLDEDYLLGSKGLIQRVDIGTTYPQTIKDLLLTDTVDARRRETLFTRELKARLPMQALEFKIRQLNGVTVTGYRYVKALMEETPSTRIVDGEEIVLRPLALCRKAGATPDEVSNVFIVEARDVSVGPHLLYRPLYEDALHEYPTRQALLDAIAEPGDLQDSVLTWLTDKARPIYDHGGIKEPHIIRFLPGDDSSISEKPAPATLAVDDGAGEWLQSQVNGQLLNHLFGSTARALVDLADRESVSNSESRWAVVMEGMWLLFNTLLLPLVTGPAMLVGWFLVLVSTLEQDLAGLDSNNLTTRELALIDLLLNTAMVLLHAAPSNRSTRPWSEPAAEDRDLPLQAWRNPEGLPPPQTAAVVRHGPVALPGEPPATGHTTLDFSHSLASPQAAAKLLEALFAVHVPWPDPLPSPLTTGVLNGLYWINGKWHASTGGLLFQVSVVPGFGDVYVVDPQHPLHPGFKLVSDGQGHWRLDRRARLEGGMPRERLSEWQRKRKARLDELSSGLQALSVEASALAPLAQQLTDAVKRAQGQLTEHKQALRADWERLASPTLLSELRPRIVERHAQRQDSTARATSAWSIAVDNYQENTQAYISTQEKSLAMARELLELDKTQIQYKEVRDIATHNIHNHLLSSYANLYQKIKNTLDTGRGESLSELLLRVDTELPNHITDAYETFISGATQRLELLKEMFDVAKRFEAIEQQAHPELRARLSSKITSNNTVSSAIIEQHRLLAFVELIVDRARDTDNPRERPFLEVLTDRRATTAILTQTKILATSGYSPAEKIDVLKGSLQQFGRLENAVNSLSEMGSGLVREHYRSAFLEQFSAARTTLEAQLAQLILSEEGFVPRQAPNRDARQKPASRRVIKTRNRETLVGDLRASEPGVEGSFVDINDPFTGQTIATYHKHANEGVWNLVDLAQPPQPPDAHAGRRTLGAIKAQAEIVKSQRPGIDASIRFQQRKLQDPGRREGLDPYEWDVMLSQHAAKFETLAEELVRNHATNAEAATLRTDYLAQASAATQQAREACAAGYKLQRPKAANVAYLWRHGFVDINLVRSRVGLKAGDFLTEYAIRDKTPFDAGSPPEDDVLWYAHFHYPTADTPASQPAFGHLKTIAERRFTRRELIEQARADNRAVVNLEKAEIRPPLDQELFLGLEVL
ncbi:hypothetical protein C4J97_2369 [Pseudomonas orientalis]|nr:hypothetical protein C4J97_2369 [Pseudomonas orientalis]